MAAHRALFVAFALALALLSGCDDNNTNVIVVDPVGDTTNVGVARGDAIADQTAAELSADQSVVVLGKTATILAAMNDGILFQSDFAAQVVIADDIFDYANREVIDHDDANAALDGVVRSLGINFVVSSSADTLADEYSAGLDRLRRTSPDEIDFAYTELQVINHAEALVLLDELAVQVGPGAMGDYIADTKVMMSDHLAVSQSLLATFF